MIRCLALTVVLIAAASGPFSVAMSAAAQEPAADCASSRWLAPALATPEAERPAVRVDEPAPTWLTTELIDACSGVPFALDVFAGKTLYIESMATWCGECFAQLTRVKEAATQIPEAEREDIVLVALSSEVGLPREELADYAATNAFPLVFAVMPEEMLKAMVDDLGRAVAIPSAMPHLIVAPDGTIGELRTGGTSPEELLALFAEARATAAP